MRDAEAETREVLDKALTELYPFPTDVEFSDDTTLLHTNLHALQTKFNFVNQEYDRFLGKNCLHRVKTKHMIIDSHPLRAAITFPDGTPVQVVTEERVVGGYFSSNHSNKAALRKRMEVGNKLMHKFKPVWKSSKISKVRRVTIVKTAPEQGALFGLSSLHLTATQHKLADSWQARQHRRALRIPAAFVSRIPNQDVLGQTGSKLLSHRISKLRVKFFAHVFRMAPHHELRKLVFLQSPSRTGHLLWRWPAARQRGRPRQRWADLALSEVHAMAEATSMTDAGLMQALREDCVQLEALRHLPPAY